MEKMAVAPSVFSHVLGQYCPAGAAVFQFWPWLIIGAGPDDSVLAAVGDIELSGVFSRKTQWAGLEWTKIDLY